MAIQLSDVFSDPNGVIERLRSGANIYGLVDVEVIRATERVVILLLTLDPLEPMAQEGYPTEKVKIVIEADGAVRAYPKSEGRRWLHRNPLGGTPLSLDLCLWYPGDPRELRWEPQDGLERYITIVHRHLMAEEFWRRTGRWPFEDAPHGQGPHPIDKETTKRAAKKWRRAWNSPR